ncbi:lipoprotein [Marinomonas sp. TW1]|nr:lipoprotein [Marinomonas sp. TW1]
MKRFGLVLLASLVSACSSDGWRTASREPAGIAPSPEVQKNAVIEVYAADAYSWRGWFAVHTWIATKAENADRYKVYEVVGWRLNRGLPALTEYQTPTPDRYWFGAKPEKLLSIQGEQAQALIPQIAQAVKVYPWKNEYKVFPGPNSNTFPAWIGQQVPELGLKLPFSAIGSGYADNSP